MKCWHCGAPEMQPVPGADYLQCPGCKATWNAVPSTHRKNRGDTGTKHTMAKDLPFKHYKRSATS